MEMLRPMKMSIGLFMPLTCVFFSGCVGYISIVNGSMEKDNATGDICYRVSKLRAFTFWFLIHPPTIVGWDKTTFYSLSDGEVIEQPAMGFFAYCATSPVSGMKLYQYPKEDEAFEKRFLSLKSPQVIGDFVYENARADNAETPFVENYYWLCFSIDSLPNMPEGGAPALTWRRVGEPKECEKVFLWVNEDAKVRVEKIDVPAREETESENRE